MKSLNHITIFSAALLLCACNSGSSGSSTSSTQSSNASIVAPDTFIVSPAVLTMSHSGNKANLNGTGGLVYPVVISNTGKSPLSAKLFDILDLSTSAPASSSAITTDLGTCASKTIPLGGYCTIYVTVHQVQYGNYVGRVAFNDASTVDFNVPIRVVSDTAGLVTSVRSKNEIRAESGDANIVTYYNASDKSQIFDLKDGIVPNSDPKLPHYKYGFVDGGGTIVYNGSYLLHPYSSLIVYEKRDRLFDLELATWNLRYRWLEAGLKLEAAGSTTKTYAGVTTLAIADQGLPVTYVPPGVLSADSDGNVTVGVQNIGGGKLSTFHVINAITKASIPYKVRHCDTSSTFCWIQIGASDLDGVNTTKKVVNGKISAGVARLEISAVETPALYADALVWSGNSVTANDSSSAFIALNPVIDVPKEVGFTYSNMPLNDYAYFQYIGDDTISSGITSSASGSCSASSIQTSVIHNEIIKIPASCVAGGTSDTAASGTVSILESGTVAAAANITYTAYGSTFQDLSSESGYRPNSTGASITRNDAGFTTYVGLVDSDGVTDGVTGGVYEYDEVGSQTWLPVTWTGLSGSGVTMVKAFKFAGQNSNATDFMAIGQIDGKMGIVRDGVVNYLATSSLCTNGDYATPIDATMDGDGNTYISTACSDGSGGIWGIPLTLDSATKIGEVSTAFGRATVSPTNGYVYAPSGQDMYVLKDLVIVNKIDLSKISSDVTFDTDDGFSALGCAPAVAGANAGERVYAGTNLGYMFKFTLSIDGLNVTSGKSLGPVSNSDTVGVTQIKYDSNSGLVNAALSPKLSGYKTGGSLLSINPNDTYFNEYGVGQVGVADMAVGPTSQFRVIQLNGSALFK